MTYILNIEIHVKDKDFSNVWTICKKILETKGTQIEKIKCSYPDFKGRML